MTVINPLNRIGQAEDGDYTDGVFTDLTPNTPIGTFADRVNELLTSLVPPPAPALDHISIVDSGTAGYLSFGSSHSIATYTNVGTEAGGLAINVNSSFPNSGQRKGIFATPTVINGVLNDDVSAHAYAYDAYAFGNGDKGTLSLEVNGIVVHTTDLTTFASGNSVNANGSGFNLSVATSVEFESGDPFDTFKYRTGTWTVAAADQRNGWNYIRVLHSEGSVTTNYYEWVIDADTTATTYSGMSFSGLSMTGSSYLSGVQYHTGGTATYNCTISNLHRNTFSNSATAITHSTQTNCTIPQLAVEAIGAPNWEAQTQVLLQTATVNSGRILDADIAASTRTDRTVQTDSTSSTTSGGYELLVDTNIAGASGQTNVAESWNAEGYRLQADLPLTSISYATGPGNGPAGYNWTPTESLVGADAGHNTGLLVYNGSLRYPTQGANGGNFSGITNGPAGNPNYSSASGIREYLRYFYVGSGKQNFTLAITVSGSTFTTVAEGPNAQELTCEILAPNTTKDGGGTVEWKDAFTAYTDDASDGCYAATYGGTIPTNWGITLGSKSTATSGNVIVIRIKAAAAWTGSVDAMTVTVL